MKFNRSRMRMRISLLVILVFSAGLCVAANLNLTVSVPASTPDDDKICITGNHHLLSNWDGKGIALKEIGPDLFAFSGNLSGSAGFMSKCPVVFNAFRISSIFFLSVTITLLQQKY